LHRDPGPSARAPIRPARARTLAAACLAGLAACEPQVEIENVGSDTMLEVAGAWCEAYTDLQEQRRRSTPAGTTPPPMIVVVLGGGGSGTGISKLIGGSLDIANSSRPLKRTEIEKASKRGAVPIEHIVGYDAIAVYVHKDNPISHLTIEQLRGLFGDGGTLTKWSDLGVDLRDPGADRVVLVSRQNNSGTWEYFREAVLGGASGRFKPECNNLNGSKDVVDFCAKTRSAIGYSGLAYATDDVRTVPIVPKAGGAPVAPSIESVLDRSYAIARPLFMITRGEPQGAVKDYLDWIKSDAGQRVLMKKGYPPIRRI
jgi:phosphate transport system substrate-binding protein